MTITEHRPSMEMMAHFVVTPSVRELAENPGFKDMPLGVVPDLISDRLPTLNRFKDLEAYYKRIDDKERAAKVHRALGVVTLADVVLNDPAVEYRGWYPSPALLPFLDEKLSASNTYKRLTAEKHQSPPPTGIDTRIQAVRFIAGLQLVSDQIASTRFIHSR